MIEITRYLTLKMDDDGEFELGHRYPIGDHDWETDYIWLTKQEAVKLANHILELIIKDRIKEVEGDTGREGIAVMGGGGNTPLPHGEQGGTGQDGEARP